MYIATRRANVKLLHLHILQASCIDSTAEPAKVLAGEVKKLQLEKMKPQEQITLEPYKRDHAVVVGVYQWVTISNFVHRGMLLLAAFLFTCSPVKKEKTAASLLLYYMYIHTQSYAYTHCNTL